MPFDARVLQVLIASPGDVGDERQLLSEMIYEWNYVNARERRVVLLPLRWETHASPELGSSPQAIINRQVVDSCDMAVGIFWTRLGTPTDVAESGTAEEIARVGEAGKPVMLYFSRAKVDLDTVDLTEYARLKEFKQKTYPQGLVEHYESLVDFREKFTRQLAIKVLDTIARHAEEKSPGETTPRARLSIELAESAPAPGRFDGPESTAESTGLRFDVNAKENITFVSAKRLACIDVDEVPDFGEEAAWDHFPSLKIGFKRIFNRDFFRRVVEYSCQPPALGPFRLAATASPQHGLRDIYIEIRVSGLQGDIASQQPRALGAPQPYSLVQDPDLLKQEVDETESSNQSADRRPVSLQASWGAAVMVGDGTTQINYYGSPSTSRLLVDKIEDGEWLVKVELPAIQAGRTVHSEDIFWIIPERGCVPSFDATIYSSDATPFASHIDLGIHVDELAMPYREIVDQFLRHHPLPD
jgi:hypothetical protein